MQELVIGRYTVFLKREVDDKYQDIVDSMLAAFSIDDDWHFGYGRLGDRKQFAMTARRHRDLKKWELIFKLDNFNTIKHVSFFFGQSVHKKELSIEGPTVVVVLDRVHEFYLKYINGEI